MFNCFFFKKKALKKRACIEAFNQKRGNLVNPL